MNRFSLGFLLSFAACIVATAAEVIVPASANANNAVNLTPADFDAFRTVLAAPFFITGALMCFFGLRLIKIIIFLSGFLPGTGFSFAFFTSLNLFSSGGANAGNAAVTFLCSLIVGIVCGCITLCCMKVAIFLTGFAAGFFAIIAAFVLLLRVNPAPILPIAFILGLFAGIAALWIWEKAVIVITAFIGACEITSGVICLFETSVTLNNGTRLPIYFVVGAVIFILGICVQNKTKPEKPDPYAGMIINPRAGPVVMLNVNQNICQTSSVNNVNNTVNNINNFNAPPVHQNRPIPHANPYGRPPVPQYPNPQYQAPPMHPPQQQQQQYQAPPQQYPTLPQQYQAAPQQYQAAPQQYQPAPSGQFLPPENHFAPPAGN